MRERVCVCVCDLPAVHFDPIIYSDYNELEREKKRQQTNEQNGKKQRQEPECKATNFSMYSHANRGEQLKSC